MAKLTGTSQVRTLPTTLKKVGKELSKGIPLIVGIAIGIIATAIVYHFVGPWAMVALVPTIGAGAAATILLITAGIIRHLYQANKTQALKDIQSKRKLLGDCSWILRNDKDFFLDAIKRGASLKGATNKLKDQHDVVMAAVKTNGLELEYASNRLKAEPSIVLEACNNNYDAFKHAKVKVQKEGFISEFLKIKPPKNAKIHPIEKLLPNNLTKQHLLYAIKGDTSKDIPPNGMALKCLKDETHMTSLNNDLGVVSAAIKLNPECFQFAGYNIRNNETYVLSLMNLFGSELFKWVGPKAKDNPHVVKKAVEKDPKLLLYAGVTIKKDVNFVASLFKKDLKLFECSDLDLQQNENFVKKLFEIDVKKAFDFARGDFAYTKPNEKRDRQYQVSFLQFALSEKAISQEDFNRYSKKNYTVKHAAVKNIRHTDGRLLRIS